MTGKDKLSEWFGLSYASWLTLPRVFMEAMPDEWQGRMADLLAEISNEFPEAPVPRVIVQAIGDDGRFQKTDSSLLNYRRPDKAMIESSRYDPPGEPGKEG